MPLTPRSPWLRPGAPRPRAGRLRGLWLPPLSTLILLLLFNTLIGNFFGLGLYTQGYATELVAGTAVAWWLYALLRPWQLFLAVQALVLGLLYLGNAYKMDFFDAPVLPADLLALPVLAQQLSGWRLLLVAAPFLLLAALFLAGLRPRWQTPVIFAAGVALVWGGAVLVPETLRSTLDGLYGYNSFGPQYNFFERGPHLYLLNEYARMRAVAGEIPSREAVSRALEDAGLGAPLPEPQLAAPRDVYLIMMETLWDPSSLKAVRFSRDPFAPAFRAMYRQAGEPRVLVPVFGGGTANSEFEALCGMPAYESGIVFITTLTRPAPCLPRLLAHLGYHGYAATADGYGLWNRGNALRLIGFQRFYDADNFDPDDRNGEFMADAALFAQTDVLLSKSKLAGPRFIFISTDSGHYPFDLDPAKRPALITTSSAGTLVTEYANAVYYDTAELAAYIQRIRDRDPDALIAAFGDHLPALQGDVYLESGLVARRDEDLTPAMLETRQGTPLLVIDGRRGPVPLGRISLFELPRRLLSLLGVRQPTLFDAFAPPAGIHPRDRDGRLLAVPDRGSPEFCTPASAAGACAGVGRWYADAQLLRADIIAGADHAGGALYGGAAGGLALPATTEPYLSGDTPSQPCGMKVIEWGPKATMLGHGFNPQRDGSPSFSIRYAGDARRVRVWLGFEELKVYATSSHDSLTAALYGRLPLLWPGDHALTLSCNGDPRRIEVGQFHVGL